jgi:hypothetical protein
MSFHQKANIYCLTLEISDKMTTAVLSGYKGVDQQFMELDVRRTMSIINSSLLTPNDYLTKKVHCQQDLEPPEFFQEESSRRVLTAV